MTITVTFRHIEPSPALKDYAVDKLGKLDKVVSRSFDANVILSVEKYRHIAEVLFTAKGISIKAVEETEDLYSAIDLVMDKVEKQVKKIREKRKEHSNYGGADRPGVSGVEEDTVHTEEISVVKLDNFLSKPMTLEDAIKHLEFSRKDVLLFLNYETKQFNVVSRLNDGRVGLIEP